MATAAREVHTSEEIRAEVHRLIHEGETVGHDGAQIRVPPPRPYADGVQEPNGSNWYMDTFGNPHGYEGWIRHVVFSVQSRWDLST